MSIEKNSCNVALNNSDVPSCQDVDTFVFRKKMLPMCCCDKLIHSNLIPLLTLANNRYH